MDIKEIWEQQQKKNQENTWKEQVFPMNKIRKAVSLLQVKHIKQEGDMPPNWVLWFLFHSSSGFLKGLSKVFEEQSVPMKYSLLRGLREIA